MRTAHTFRLPPELAAKLADYATQKQVPQALVVETALVSFLSPDGADRLESAGSCSRGRATRTVRAVGGRAAGARSHHRMYRVYYDIGTCDRA